MQEQRREGDAAPDEVKNLVMRLVGLDDPDAMQIPMAGNATQIGFQIFAELAKLSFNPNAIQAITEDARHPLIARRFATLNSSNFRESWGQQERRLIARYVAAKEEVEVAKKVSAASEKALKDSCAKLEDVSTDLVLMRMTLAMRGLQEFAKPLLDRMALVTLMVALFGDAAKANGEDGKPLREQTKRTYGILAKRVDDEAFLQGIGHVIREYACRYDDEAGAEGRLSLAAASEIADRWLVNSEAFEKFNEVLQGKEADATIEPKIDIPNPPSNDEDIGVNLPF